MANVLSYHPNLFDQVTCPPQVYPDSNFLISFYAPKHPWHNNAVSLLIELTSQKVEIHVSLLAMDEALYQLLIIFYEAQHGKASWERGKSGTLKKEPDVCSRFHSELSAFVTALQGLKNVRFIDISTPCQNILDDLMMNISSYSLAPRDACHLAILNSLGLKMIITNDSDFERVHDLPIYVLHFW